MATKVPGMVDTIGAAIRIANRALDRDRLTDAIAVCGIDRDNAKIVAERLDDYFRAGEW